ncbi:MAG: 30S ribosomal protein S8 [Gammaproteobacteria bacterium RIFCSPHIGHO2_12_FULL_41_15]|nr:MAG: 30S ribosomal protein S8 [Gammaproteobacteria bacterium RIFCSPHIGHO2_12_FULL_41_15]
MSMQDPIADMLTRMRNAQAVNKQTVAMQHSKIKSAIAHVLKDEGYIADYFYNKEDNNLVIELKYCQSSGAPVIDEMKRVSRPGLRVYVKSKNMPSIQTGLGEAIISTSKGVMTAKAAKKLGLGGEFICYVS